MENRDTAITAFHSKRDCRCFTHRFRVLHKMVAHFRGGVIHLLLEQINCTEKQVQPICKYGHRILDKWDLPSTLKCQFEPQLLWYPWRKKSLAHEKELRNSCFEDLLLQIRITSLSTLPSSQFVEFDYGTPKNSDEHPEAEDYCKTHLLLHLNM